ncbi:hypothetical protein [Sorangium sp. So ce388]|uniref:hypothetical protein n=1 Tax=Sorangium sp. So ce388 TaxID=3133309 RepID=UPI003F5BB45A
MSNDTRCGILRRRCNARHSSLAAEGRCDQLARCGAALVVAVVATVAAPARAIAPGHPAQRWRRSAPAAGAPDGSVAALAVAVSGGSAMAEAALSRPARAALGVGL